MRRWTQKLMREVAQEEREALGLASGDRMDPYRLADEHGIPIYTLSELREWDLAEGAHQHFFTNTKANWSAALVPLGRSRVIIENDGHADVRRRASIAHELGHHLLEHAFEGVLIGADHSRVLDTTKEKEANFVAGELLVPEAAAIKAAFARWTNTQVARAFGVSEQFAQMQMKGPRVVAARAERKHRGS